MFSIVASSRSTGRLPMVVTKTHTGETYHCGHTTIAFFRPGLAFFGPPTRARRRPKREGSRTAGSDRLKAWAGRGERNKTERTVVCDQLPPRRTAADGNEREHSQRR